MILVLPELNLDNLFGYLTQINYLIYIYNMGDDLESVGPRMEAGPSTASMSALERKVAAKQEAQVAAAQVPAALQKTSVGEALTETIIEGKLAENDRKLTMGVECWKQKPKLGTWEKRIVKLEGNSLNIYGLSSDWFNAGKKRGSSIEDISKCNVVLFRSTVNNEPFGILIIPPVGDNMHIKFTNKDDFTLFRTAIIKLTGQKDLTPQGVQLGGRRKKRARLTKKRSSKRRTSKRRTRRRRRRTSKKRAH